MLGRWPDRKFLHVRPDAALLGGAGSIAHGPDASGHLNGGRTKDRPILPVFSTGTALFVAAALILAAPLAAQDAPISLTSDDPSLEWGPCADFMPHECQAATLRLGPEGRNSDVLFRIPANMALPAHWHTSPERMILLSGEFHVDYEGHAPLVMRAGSYAWGPPGVHHTARCGDQGTCLLLVAFVDPPDGFPADDG